MPNGEDDDDDEDNNDELRRRKENFSFVCFSSSFFLSRFELKCSSHRGGTRGASEVEAAKRGEMQNGNEAT